jgi:hypothetical protein
MRRAQEAPVDEAAGGVVVPARGIDERDAERRQVGALRLRERDLAAHVPTSPHCEGSSPIVGSGTLSTITRANPMRTTRRTIAA